MSAPQRHLRSKERTRLSPTIRFLKCQLPCAAFVMLMVAAVTIPAGTAKAVPHPGGGISTLGLYQLTSSYNGTIANTRGWRVEWRVPALSNSNVAWGAIGQWYYNFETGIYRTPQGWFVYYFGDDDGTAGNNPDCNLVWGSGGTCQGALGSLRAGQEIYFSYEWCDASHAASVNGGYLCAWVDMEDGAGWRFLASEILTSTTTVEMYAHDIETFADSGPAYPEPVISCSQPTVMLQQQGKTYRSGYWIWAFISGPFTWTFNDTTSTYKFQNKQLWVRPSHWESCSG